MSNLAIQANVIKASNKAGVERLLFLGSSCIYPKNCPQPIKEEYLLSSELEPTNRPYALAKIAGIEMCWSYNRQFNTQYLAVMPTNLYGPNDNYDLENSHVLPALIRKMHEAKINNNSTVEIWGSGKQKREFLHSGDLAIALTLLMNLDKERFQNIVSKHLCPVINIGFGKEITIYELAHLLKKTTQCEADLIFNKSKPDGTPLKLIDSEKINKLGWVPKVNFVDGILEVYDDFLHNHL
jgi:GDP-L-fucose synthase